MTSAMHASDPVTLHTHLPEGMLEAPASELQRFLPSMSLVYLQGRLDPPLFVSVLQHGNEPTGWQALQQYLKQCHFLPRSLLVFFGNLEAAGQQKRFLDHQADYNRSWPGGDNTESETARKLAAVFERIEQIAPSAAVDFHNNSGENPHYAVVSSTEPSTLAMAGAFSDLCVYFQYPRGVQSMALQAICPAITVECGISGNQDAVVHCRDFLTRLLEQSPGATPDNHSMRLFQLAASIRMAEQVDFAFGQPAAVNFRPDLDQLNFRELPAGTCLGETNDISALHFHDQAGQRTDNRWLRLHQRQLMTCKRLMPAMLSTQAEVVRQDCLGYLLEPLAWTGKHAPVAD